MDFATLVQVLGPTGALLALGISGLKVFWPSYERHAERRTAAEEKQAVAFERIADLSEQIFARLGEVQRVTDDNRADLIGIYERMGAPRPSRRTTNRKITTPASSGS